MVVVFTDRRRFTAFTDSSEPEEVMGVLGEYHRVMGPLIISSVGTLSYIAGDGLMVLFNDPIKLEDPLANAVNMAIKMQEKFVPLRTSWKKRGYELDLGIGIAQGYASLRAIGFEGRWEYTCIGSVANRPGCACAQSWYGWFGRPTAATCRGDTGPGAVTGAVGSSQRDTACRQTACLDAPLRGGNSRSDGALSRQTDGAWTPRSGQ